jgi:hypothetical protein
LDTLLSKVTKYEEKLHSVESLALSMQNMLNELIFSKSSSLMTNQGSLFPIAAPLGPAALAFHSLPVTSPLSDGSVIMPASYSSAASSLPGLKEEGAGQGDLSPSAQNQPKAPPPSVESSWKSTGEPLTVGYNQQHPAVERYRSDSDSSSTGKGERGGSEGSGIGGGVITTASDRVTREGLLRSVSSTSQQQGGGGGGGYSVASPLSAATTTTLITSSTSSYAPHIAGIPGADYTSSLGPLVDENNVKRLQQLSYLGDTSYLEALPEEWNALSSSFDELDGFLAYSLPQLPQLQYRSSALALLKRLVRAIIGVMSYDIGFYPIRCFLSDDGIKLTVMLNQTQLAFWQTTLTDKLKHFIDNTLETNRFLEQSQSDQLDDCRILLNHHLKSVQQGLISERALSSMPASVGSAYKVIGVIDNLEFEVTANNRSELCFLEFYEEIDILIGQNHLFKRSVILIRSWWMYEAPSYVANELNSNPAMGGMGGVTSPMYGNVSNQSGIQEISSLFPSDNILVIMIISIFNRFHQQITHPFLALLLFLKEYSSFDYYNAAISIFGPLSYENDTSNQPKLIFPTYYQLISIEMIEKYWRLFNLQDPLNIEPPSGHPKPQLDASMKFELLKTSMFRAIQRFPRYGGYDILHPFTCSNMIDDKLTNRKLMLINKMFSIGYSTVNDLMKKASEGVLMVKDIPSYFFPVMMEKLVKNKYRLDAVNNVVPAPGVDPAWYDV